MLKKAITYVDFNDETVTEEFFFHLSKAELVELEMSHEGGLSESLQRIIAAEDTKGIIKEFKNIILTSYGKKSPDGRRFIKNQELREEFESTEAYSVLFMELVTETDKAVEFINGIIPAGMAEEAAKLGAQGATSETPDKPELTAVPEARVITKAEFDAMSSEDFANLRGKIASGEVKLAD